MAIPSQQIDLSFRLTLDGQRLLVVFKLTIRFCTSSVDTIQEIYMLNIDEIGVKEMRPQEILLKEGNLQKTIGDI